MFSATLPAVSVIVLHNRNKEAIQETLASVLAQTYPNTECLLASNAPKLELDAILAGYRVGQVQSVVAGPEASEATLLQLALAQTTGKYIFFLISGDTFCAPDVLARLLTPEAALADVISGNILRMYPDGEQDVFQFPAAIIQDDFRATRYNLSLGALFRKELLIKHNYADVTLRYLHAWFLMVKAFFLATGTYLHQDVLVAKVAVSRSGGWHLLSSAHLIEKERSRLVTEFAPFLQYPATHPSGHLQNILSQVKYHIRSVRSRLELAAYKRKHQATCKQIPIIINNKNQLTYLQRLLVTLEKRGYTNIYIIDNASTYPPLLEFYASTPYKVFHLANNVGFCALWDTNIFEHFKSSYYVYTDSDLELLDECPEDFMVVLQYLLHKYSLGKIGLSLAINDLPEHFVNKQEVITWEQRFQEHRIERLAFAADVDSTFALYKPGSFGYAGLIPSFRAAYPYSARHLPWYENTQHLTKEQQFYYKNASTSSHWSSKVSIQ